MGVSESTQSEKSRSSLEIGWWAFLAGDSGLCATDGKELSISEAERTEASKPPDSRGMILGSSGSDAVVGKGESRMDSGRHEELSSTLLDSFESCEAVWIDAEAEQSAVKVEDT